MKAFGYDKNDEECENILKLSQVTLSCQKEDLDKIIEFLNKVKNDSQSINLTDGNHWHFRDFNKSWSEEDPDLIVFLDKDSN